jgi:uncharacterized membrane protein YczE
LQQRADFTSHSTDSDCGHSKQEAMMTTTLTDTLEREYAARYADPVSRPIRLERLVRGRNPAPRPNRVSPSRDRLGVRWTQLLLGLGLYGMSEALMLAPAVGVDPWDVLHTGLARITGIPVGTVLILVSVAVMPLWWALRQRPGVGTIANIAVIGPMVDVILGAAAVPHALWLRWTMFAAGVLLNAVATGLYIGAGFGPGPRDGLTTGLAKRGHSIRLVRTGIELSVLALGWLLGGNVGVGTVLYSLAIGPLVHVTIPLFAGGHHTPGDE